MPNLKTRQNFFTYPGFPPPWIIYPCDTVLSGHILPDTWSDWILSVAIGDSSSCGLCSAYGTLDILLRKGDLLNSHSTISNMAAHDCVCRLWGLSGPHTVEGHCWHKMNWDTRNPCYCIQSSCSISTCTPCTVEHDIIYITSLPSYTHTSGTLKEQATVLDKGLILRTLPPLTTHHIHPNSQCDGIVQSVVMSLMYM